MHIRLSVLATRWLAAVLLATFAGVSLAADAGHRRTLLVWGLAALIAADLLIALSASLIALFAAVLLWGVHLGLTQGLLSKLVADVAPHELRGTAFGVFHLVSGVALFAASLLAGGLWSAFGPSTTFLAGALFASVALAGLITISAREK